MVRKAGKAGIVIAVAGAAGIAMFAPPLFVGVLNAGSIAGVAACAVVLVYGMCFRTANAALARAWRRGPGGKAAVGALAAAVVALVVLVTVGVARISVSAAAPPPKKDATVVVLGARIRGDEPSLSLSLRLDAAYDYLDSHPDAACIVSGGIGPGETTSEAEVMRRELVARGIAPERIYLEDESTSTRENIANSLRIIEANGLPRELAIVSSDYHECRAQDIAGRFGLESGAVSAPTPWWLMPSYVLREALLLPFERLARL